MKKEVRKCAVCGKKFTPKSANAAYCSDKCYKVAKAKKDKARKAAKKSAKSGGVKFLEKAAKVKPIIKANLKEKVVLPKKPVAKVAPKTVKKPNPDTIISVKNGNPFKVFFLATVIRDRAMREIVKSGKLFVS